MESNRGICSGFVILGNLRQSRKMVCGVCGLEAGGSRRPLNNAGEKGAAPRQEKPQ